METQEERRAREQEVAANLLKRFEPQGATMAMVEAALAEAAGTLSVAVKLLTRRLIEQELQNQPHEAHTRARMHAHVHTRAPARKHARALMLPQLASVAKQQSRCL